MYSTQFWEKVFCVWFDKDATHIQFTIFCYIIISTVDSQTPLYLAVAMNKPEEVKCLLNYNAKTSLFAHVSTFYHICFLFVYISNFLGHNLTKNKPEFIFTSGKNMIITVFLQRFSTLNTECLKIDNGYFLTLYFIDGNDH